MATESVATPRISIDAQEFLDRYKALQDMMARLCGVEGVLALLDEVFEKDTPANCALSAAWRLAKDCREASFAADWPISLLLQCEQIVGITEDAA